MSLLFMANGWLKRLYRQGPYFQKLSQELFENHTFSREMLERYQLERLQKMIHYCYDNVPYYTDLFNRLGLKHNDFQTLQDLRKIPVLDKHIVKANYEKLIAKNIPKVFCKTAHTSGTTGMPSTFLRDYHSINFENAIVWRYWKQAGDHGKKRLTIRGNLVVPAGRTVPPFWKYNPANRELVMSAYHLSSDNSRAYLDQILKFKPEVLCSFPTMALLLAKYFRAHQIGYSFDAVFTSSEYLEPFIRHYVEETFQTRIYDWYGQAERVAVLGQCRYGTYHVQEDYSLVELVPGKNGDEIIGSHLHNFIMPLLRYRTGDHVIPSQGGCACGHSSRAVERIVGRSPEMLITPEGYHIVCAPAFVFKGIESVIEAQFYQEKPGEVVIKVITKNGLSEPDRDVLIKNTLRYTSPHMRINIEEVPKIERGPNGKYLSVINKCMSLYDSDFMCPETAPMAIKNT